MERLQDASTGERVTERPVDVPAPTEVGAAGFVLAFQGRVGNAAVNRLLAGSHSAPLRTRSLQRDEAAEARRAFPEAAYEGRLREAVALLEKEKIGFARAENWDPEKGDDWFDHSFWKKKDDPEFQYKLVLLDGKSPAAAIDALFGHQERWHVDCSQFVQVAHLFALRHALGAEEFDHRQKAAGAVELKQQGSTGVRRALLFRRTSPNKPMRRSADEQEEPKSVEQLLDEAPAGSRVMWTNLDPDANGTPFKNENTLKLGIDSFAAHGFSQKVFERSDLEAASPRQQRRARRCRRLPAPATSPRTSSSPRSSISPLRPWRPPDLVPALVPLERHGDELEEALPNAPIVGHEVAGPLGAAQYAKDRPPSAAQQHAEADVAGYPVKTIRTIITSKPSQPFLPGSCVFAP
jgi:hypothetical protein